jgi:DNA-binding XRE family transcriptional regulator
MKEAFVTNVVQLAKIVGVSRKKLLERGKVKPKNKINNQIVLHCVVNTWIGTNKILVAIQLHTFSISATTRAGSFRPIRQLVLGH